MRSTERVVVYSLLAAALGLGAGVPLGGLAQANRQNAVVEPARIATIDALALIDLMLQSERYEPARSAKVKELNDQMVPIGREVTDLESKLIMGKKDDPQRDTMVQTWQGKKQQMQQLQQALSAELDKFNSKQASDAYDIVLATSDVLAKQGGYTHVLMTRKERAFTAENQAGTVQQLLSRPLALWPASDDLTDLAIKELKLEGISLERKQKQDAAEADAAKPGTPAPAANSPATTPVAPAQNPAEPAKDAGK